MSLYLDPVVKPRDDREK
ncbi:MAG TPA: palindromic element RPE4 domain-containing protein [Rickettsia endosymbiont of Bembidion lapponicum]|nr:palindromic element RPE4 domain-containing protein [Rickettsia endosymbiont of Bembidion lapponicum]